MTHKDSLWFKGPHFYFEFDTTGLEESPGGESCFWPKCLGLDFLRKALGRALKKGQVEMGVQEKWSRHLNSTNIFIKFLLPAKYCARYQKYKDKTKIISVLQELKSYQEKKRMKPGIKWSV